MVKNVGPTDKSIRLTAGIVIIFAGIYYDILLLVIVGIIPLVTAFIGYCPLYSMFGINTCKK